MKFKKGKVININSYWKYFEIILHLNYYYLQDFNFSIHGLSSIKDRVESDSSGSEGEDNRQGFYVGGSNQRFIYFIYNYNFSKIFTFNIKD